jgi:hypothetical protein
MAAGTSDAPSAASDTSEELPNIAPLKGPVPLPRRRPNVVAMAEPAPSGVTQTGVPPAGVPLPRARPADAPAASADTPASDTPSFNREVAH